MAGLGNLATTAIITKGLTRGHGPLTACRSGIITSHFSLYCTGIVPPGVPSKGGGGGPYPRDAWNKYGPGDIQNFYKPVPDDQQFYHVPRDKEAEYFRRDTHVVLRVKIGDFQVEKEYAVAEKHEYMIVNVLNMLNVTRERIKVTFSGIKRITTRLVVAASKLRLRRKHK